MLRIERRFYQRDPVTVARTLLGQLLVRVIDGQRLSGIIVETEAYLGIDDLAAHTARGRRTQRNHSMWLDGGTAYIYFTYGLHHCFNIVTQTIDQPTAVLIRALQPVEGLPLMHKHRQRDRKKHDRTLRDDELTTGPARLCSALQLDRCLDGIDLCASDVVWVEQVRQRAYAADRIAVTPRIGVSYAGDWANKPLRFLVKGNAFVSR